MKYIPLRVKTSYSLLTSLNDIKKMILFCKEKGINTLCITDTNMYGVMEFYRECNNNGIKPVIGLELSINNNIVLLYAKNYLGYQNLTRLIFIKQNEELTKEILQKYSSNLICVTDNYDEYSEIYSDIYYGYTDINEKDFTKKSVYINNILCLTKKDIEYLPYLYMIKHNKKLNDNIDLKIQSNSYFDFLDYDYDNALELASKCNIEFVQNKDLMPKYDVEDSKEYLFNLCKKGLYKRLDSKVTKNYYDRLLYELDVIDKMKFNDYFLVVWDYVKYAKKMGILIGSGRGSAAGSLVSYSLGITDIDPIKYNLLFERFLNPERVTMPDIDIDFESNRREEVVKYVIDKYGKKNVVPIITFSTLGGRQVVRDVGRIFDVNSKVMDRICKYIPQNTSLKDAINNIDFKRKIESDKLLTKLFSIALKLDGLKRQISVHAAGIIISPYELDSYIPLTKYDDNYICSFDKDYIEDLGLIKMDLLGLKNLTLIENVLNEIKEKDNTLILYKDIPINDENALKLFTYANTCGIFQFESIGMKRFLEKLKPTNMEDIFAAIALFRPGPASNIDNYIKRKNGLERIDYIDDSLIDVLKPTYGIIIYQEQIIKIANIMAGYSYAEADILRRAMSKKKKEIMLSEKDKFVKRSIERGYKEDIALKTYEYILKFAEYGFNKAHSVAYSYISLKMAYLKYYYKEYFMASLLTNAIGNEEKTKEYISECKKLDINILKPDINISDYMYKKEDNAIRFSLATIRNVGSITCKEIITERSKNGEFKDYFDFIKRVYGKSVNKNTIESLIDAGALRQFGNNKTLHTNIDAAINYATLTKDLDESFISKPIIINEVEFESDELSRREKEIFGFYLTNHPVLKYKELYKNIINTNEIEKYFDKVVNLILYVNRIIITNTKKGEKMCFISGSDEIGDVDITVFPKQYDLIDNIDKQDIILVTGKVQRRLSKYQVVLQKLKKL